jgi:RNA polymerase sigma-70 factor, ECF subfamily
MITRTPSTSAHEQFRRLFASHYRAVLAYALRRCRTPQDAQDVAAETFTVAWRRMGDVGEVDDALPWLYGIAARVLANQRRAGYRFEALQARLWRQPPGAHRDSSGEWRSVLEALHRLAPGDQEILRLAAWEGLAHSDIARVLGCSERAVAIRLHRARKRLVRELGEADRAPEAEP